MRVPTLENERVKLTLLDLSNYKHLSEIAQQPNLVQYSPSKIDTTEDLILYVKNAVECYYQKSAIPFIIFDKQANMYAGSTRFMNINWNYNVLEIGSTWIGKEFQGTGLNTNMKSLMLEYAFDVLNFEKVEFRIDERNLRSRMAVEKLGSKLEGVLRKNLYLLDGFKRNSCCYGILKEEWEVNKIDVFKKT